MIAVLLKQNVLSPIAPACISIVEVLAAERLTSSKWPSEILCQFFAGWHAMHGTALFVSGLLIRVNRRASEFRDPSRLTCYQVAAEIGEIIPEDTGVDDIPHVLRFNEFANFVVGSDLWKLSKYAVEGCEQFRLFVQNQRLSASIEEGILTTAASENWNTGEYTYLEPILRQWLTEILSRPDDIVAKKIGYVTVHAGRTELGHFLHAIKAWELYCAAREINVDAEFAKQVFENYFDRLGTAFASLEEIFSG